MAGVEFILTNPGVRILAGAGCLSRLREEVVHLGARRVLVVTNRSVAGRTPLVERVVELLGESHAGTFVDSVYEPSAGQPHREGLSRLAAETRPDLLLSVGGGTVVGYAEGLALELAGGRLGAPKLPILTVPTTLSGAEANAGFVLSEGVVRMDPRLRPETAILDPEATVYTPDELFLSSGFNAINHCVEGVLSNAHSDWCDAYYLQALRLLAGNLPRCSAREPGLRSRGAALIGGYMSCMMVEFTQVAIAHAICHGLQRVCGSAHGLNNTVMVTHGMRYNLDVAADRLALLAPALDVVKSATARETALACIEAIERLRAVLGLPASLRDVPGVSRESLPAVADAAMRDFLIPFNPRRPESVEELQQLIEGAW